MVSILDDKVQSESNMLDSNRENSGVILPVAC